eukprot:256752_1
MGFVAERPSGILHMSLRAPPGTYVTAELNNRNLEIENARFDRLEAALISRDVLINHNERLIGSIETLRARLAAAEQNQAPPPPATSSIATQTSPQNVQPQPANNPPQEPPKSDSQKSGMDTSE